MGWLFCKTGPIWNILPTHLSHFRSNMLHRQAWRRLSFISVKRKPAYHSPLPSFYPKQRCCSSRSLISSLFLVQAEERRGSADLSVPLPPESSEKCILSIYIFLSALWLFSLKCWSVTPFTFIYHGKVSAGCHLTAPLACWCVTQHQWGYLLNLIHLLFV